MRFAVRIGPVLASVLLVAACGAPEPRTLPPPSSTSSTEPTTTTTRPDHSQIALERVPGETTTTAPMAEGSATLRGTVQGPDGPVPDAVVRADRLVGDAVQRSEVRTGPDGTFTMDGIPGGRFRVRAFLPPTLTMDGAEVFYLADGDERQLRLVVQAFSGMNVRASTTPSAPVVGQGVNLAVRVSEQTVDGDGVAREVPQAGVLVRVTYSGWTAVGDEDPDSGPGDYLANTNGDGIALFEFRCDRVTNVSATAVVGPEEETVPLDVPPCSPRPTTTTTTSTTSTSVPGDDDDDDDDDGPTTTTTR